MRLFKETFPFSIPALEHESIVKVHECLGPGGASLETVGVDLPAVYIIQELLDTDLPCLTQSGQLTEQHTQLFLYQVYTFLCLHFSFVFVCDDEKCNEAYSLTQY